MTPAEFIQKWSNSQLKESAASQTHFNDLCRLLGIKDPVSADPSGQWFTFEKGATKTTGGEGWADVWRKGCFAWEYKGKKKDLDKAFAQLQQYAIALENPPLLIVSDMDRFRIHTNWTNTVQEVHEISLEDLADASKRDMLRDAFDDPERFKPTRTRQMVTEEAAEEFSQLAQRLRERGHDGHVVAHFVNRLVFCMFAEDVGLLPDHMFTAMLKASTNKPDTFGTNASTLFGAMKSGGLVGFTKVEWFNGGLFDDDSTLPLEGADIDNLISAAALDWSDVDPSILGTLFERGLDPGKRSQLGAHYTDREKIMQIVEPVIIRPLMAEWTETRTKIEWLIAKAEQASGGTRTKAENEAKRLQAEWHERLRNFRVLDPACGSGNFLYLSLMALKDIEHRSNLEAEALSPSLAAQFPNSGPENVLGIELNTYAAELARVSVWIGEIQWMRRNGFEASKSPILKPLGNIENRDAVLVADEHGNPLLDKDGKPQRAAWPEADVVVGNPPFLGDKKMFSSLGKPYTLALRGAYKRSLAGRSDLVCYWFSQALDAMVRGKLDRAGLVATNSIRQKSNRGILSEIIEISTIYEAWSDEPWVVDGASVRVSLVCFGSGLECGAPSLDGKKVDRINANLTGSSSAEVIATNVDKLPQNAGIAFQGIKRVGKFEVPREQALEWVSLPVNPNGRNNSDVLRPWASGYDIVRRPQDYWIVDFGWDTPIADAALYEAPFQYLENTVRPIRHGKREARANEMWWIYYWPRPELRTRLKKVRRFAARPSVSKHHVFRWLESTVLPDGALVVVAKDDDATFGVLQSKFHELWGLSRGSTLEDRPAYTPSTTFETFPFPEGLTPDIPAADYADDPCARAIAKAAARLNELRENWLNPPDLVDRVPEVVEGYPDRILPKDEAAARELKKRTLTNLYNARPAWLAHAHSALDEAVADAYGWGDDFRTGILSDDEILARLFALNQERAALAS